MHTLATRDTVDAVIASFVAPARVETVSGSIARGPDELSTAVAVVRERYAADDESLVIALCEADVPVGHAARLVGVTITTANRWLDDGLVLDTGLAASGAPRALELARRTVRTVWVVLAALAVVATIQLRGGLVPCREVVCIDGVWVVLDDGSEVAAKDASIYRPDEVTGIRFRHRADAAFSGTVVWSNEGRPILEVPVDMRGDDELLVGWSGSRLPQGVHVVTLEGAPSGSGVTFAVANRD